jgi:hypothetical protein
VGSRFELLFRGVDVSPHALDNTSESQGASRESRSTDPKNLHPVQCALACLGNPELAPILEEEILPQILDLMEGMKISIVHDLSRQLKALGHEKGTPLLMEAGERLTQLSEAFDIDGINLYLKSFTETFTAQNRG